MVKSITNKSSAATMDMDTIEHEQLRILTDKAIIMSRRLQQSARWQHQRMQLLGELEEMQHKWLTCSLWPDEYGIHAGLMALAPDCEVPLHDHPGNCGVGILLEGTLQLEKFTIESSGCYQRLVRIRCVGSKLLRKGMVSTFTRRASNLHRLQNHDQLSLVLTLRTTNQAGSTKYCYLPVHGCDKGSYMARRLPLDKLALGRRHEQVPSGCRKLSNGMPHLESRVGEREKDAGPR